MDAVDDVAAVAAMIELDAREFGTHVRQGGWRLGLLVARNVEPGLKGNQHLPPAHAGGKVSMSEFARLAFGTEGALNRVRRYFDAWELAASKGIVPHAADMTPGDEPRGDWEKLPPWSNYFGTAALREHEGGATGPLNLTVRLGRYGERLQRTHARLITFFTKDVETARVGKDVRKLAGRYADCLDVQISLLRRLEAGEALPPREELRELLDPHRFFDTVR